jgi:lantibiotic biosynthesis protein
MAKDRTDLVFNSVEDICMISRNAYMVGKASSQSIPVDRAGDVIRRVIEDLPASKQMKNPYISSGSSIAATLLVEAYPIVGDNRYLDRAADYINCGVDMLGDLPLSSSLYSGLPGIGWAVQNFPHPEKLQIPSDFLEDIDLLLADGIEETNNINIDVINGLSGVLIYALSRQKKTDSSRTLWKILERKVSDILGHWLEFRSGSGHTLASSTGLNNLGLAHGVPGLLSVTSKSLSSAMLEDAIRPVLISAFDELWRDAQEKGGKCFFGYQRGDQRLSRLAWCYGGLGLASVFKSGIHIKVENTERMNAILSSSAEQYFSGDHGILDASLCHGHAGLAMSCQYLSSGENCSDVLRAKLQEIAVLAAESALGSEVKTDSGSVFLRRTPTGYQSSISFLEGSVGVALCMSALLSKSRSNWLELLAYF